MKFVRLLLGTLVCFAPIALPSCASKTHTDPGSNPTPGTVDVSFVSNVHDGKDTGVPDLEPSIPAAQIKAFVDNFSWQKTNALAELNADGTPALYYARVYVKSHEEVAYLDPAFIHHSNLPLLSSERTQWEGKMGRVRPPSDGRGAMIYSVIPG